MKLTDEQLTQLAAEKVRGWFWDEEMECWCAQESGEECLAEGPNWSPLTDWRAAGEIVDKMRADGWNGCSLASAAGQNMYDFFHGPNDGKLGANAPQDSMPRSITIAALLAVRAITEDQV